MRREAWPDSRGKAPLKLPQDPIASKHRLGFRSRMRSAEEKGAKGVAPRRKAVFSQDAGENRPSWRDRRDFSVSFAQGALEWEAPCVAPLSLGFAGYRHAHPRRQAPVRLVRTRGRAPAAHH